MLEYQLTCSPGTSMKATSILFYFSFPKVYAPLKRLVSYVSVTELVLEKAAWLIQHQQNCISTRIGVINNSTLSAMIYKYIDICIYIYNIYIFIFIYINININIYI